MEKFTEVNQAEIIPGGHMIHEERCGLWLRSQQSCSTVNEQTKGCRKAYHQLPEPMEAFNARGRQADLSLTHRRGMSIQSRKSLPVRVKKLVYFRRCLACLQASIQVCVDLMSVNEGHS